MQDVCEYGYIPELFRCSKCGNGYRVLNLDTDMESIANYCPNCGAKVVG